MTTESIEATTRKRTEEIIRRTEDLTASDREGAAFSLLMAALEVLKAEHPKTFTTEDRQRVRDNYPSATDAKIDQYAMSEEGTYMATASLLKVTQIVLDYSPYSHCKSDVDKDLTLPNDVSKRFSNLLMTAFTEAQRAGLSTFGAARSMIFHGTVMAKKEGVSGLKLMRILSSAMSNAINEPDVIVISKEKEEDIITSLCQHFGISRATAKKYIAQEKNTNPDFFKPKK